MADKNNISGKAAASAWIDVAFIQEALQHTDEENLQVLRVTVGSATAPGDHYSSTMYRIKAALSDGSERTLVMKTLPPTDYSAKTIVDMGIFKREGVMLENIIPQMENLLNAAAPGRYTDLAPRCLRSGTNPVEYLLMEDLASQGFKLANRHKGLGLRHCLIAVRALARLHAASVPLLQTDPDLERELGVPWRLVQEAGIKFVPVSIQSTIDLCRQWAGFEEIVDCLEKFKEKALPKFVELQERRPGGFNVIVHGDFWTNNMLFRYEDGQPQDVRFVDLQISHVSSPVMDLLYFLSCSPSENVSEHHEDLLVREYHKALVDAMEILGLEPPTLEALLQDMDASGCFTLFGTAGVIPIVKAVKPVDVEAKSTGDVRTDEHEYKELSVLRWLQRVLPKLHRKGWLQ